MHKTIFLLLVAAVGQLTGSPIQPNSLELRLEHGLLAPCCYHETVDRHQSETALDMKKQIHQMVQSGMSERQILDQYKAAYGARILAEPEGLTWWMETVVPVLMCGLGLGLVVGLIRRWSRAQLPAPAV
jgi:cytochrome c-type biogenesis protein CcmH